MFLALLIPMTVLAAEGEEAPQPAMYATFWALVPPIVAIALALITKEVYRFSVCRYSGRRTVLLRFFL